MRCIRATASCRKMHGSPKFSKSTRSPLSGRPPSISASWATRSRPRPLRSTSVSRSFPGSPGPVRDVGEGRKIAGEIGYPILVKAAAGGGGRGMKVANNEAELELALSTAKTEAMVSFGDDTVYLEKYLAHPRHIEIQVLGDGQGRAIHLGERDCSIQRRHQKLWEEALSPALNESERVRIGETVARAMRELRYRG